MDLAQLRGLVMLAECGTMTLAAERLFISQSGLSRQIRTLEHELGITFFDRQRGSRRLSLTNAGERFLDQARALLSEADVTYALAGELRKETGGLMRVAAPSASLNYVVRPAYAQFREQWQEVDFQPVEGSLDSILSLVEDGKVDLAVGVIGSPSEKLSSETLFSARMYAILSPRHRLATRKFLTAEELALEKLLLYTPSHSHQFARDLTFHLVHIQRRVPGYVFETNIPSTTLAYAELEVGIAVITDVVPIHEYDTVAIPVIYKEQQIESPAIVAWQRRRRLPKFMRDFIDILKAQSAQRQTPGYSPYAGAGTSN
jgi:DNA-binding transcriptional LysR family regulator